MKTPHKRAGEILGRDQVKRDELRRAKKNRKSPEVIIPLVRENERLNAHLNLGRRATIGVVFRVLNEQVRIAGLPFKSPPEPVSRTDCELAWYSETPARSYPDDLRLPK